MDGSNDILSMAILATGLVYFALPSVLFSPANTVFSKFPVTAITSLLSEYFVQYIAHLRHTVDE